MHALHHQDDVEKRNAASRVPLLWYEADERCHQLGCLRRQRGRTLRSPFHSLGRAS